MKKTLIVSMIGLAAAATVSTSQAQGLVKFSSYVANNGAGAVTDEGGNPVGPTYFAGLYFALGTVADPTAGNPVGIPGAPFALVTDPAATVAFQTGAAAGAPGYFDSGNVVIPGYAAGAVSFEVVAWKGGASYGDVLNTFRGRSAVFTMSSIATPGNPAPALGDNGQLMPNFSTQPVPEPSTLALLGLGTGALLFLRRRK